MKEIEQERKYIFKTEYSQDPREQFNLIKTVLNLSVPKYVENQDTYYDDNDILKSYRITLRKRVSKGKIKWTVKRPISNNYSIFERLEKNFETVLEAILFIKSEWNIIVKNLEEKVTLNTFREVYYLEYNNSLCELVFDKTTPTLNSNEYQTNYMVECELKKGDLSVIDYVDNIIKQFKFIEECEFSKKEIALDTISFSDINNYDYDVKIYTPKYKKIKY